jgi:hypothetical protein
MAIQISPKESVLDWSLDMLYEVSPMAKWLCVEVRFLTNNSFAGISHRMDQFWVPHSDAAMELALEVKKVWPSWSLPVKKFDTLPYLLHVGR